MSVFDLHYHHHCQITICSLSINTASIYTYIAQREDFFLVYLQHERIEEKQTSDSKRWQQWVSCCQQQESRSPIVQRTMQLGKKESL